MKWINRVTWLYLLLPFVLFCMGWLRLSLAAPLTVFFIWILIILYRGESGAGPTLDLGRLAGIAFLIAALWVLFSGVGGLAFQNWDHHWRNAVLHDLIDYDWPVLYASSDSGPVRMLVYYVGFWLPAALAGKWFGWAAANIFLLLWTILGVVLAGLQLAVRQRTSMLYAMLLLIFFSGADALGTLLLAPEYPALWPPVQHLELWSMDLQYSSFTTQLFWVFNSAVPAWLCSLLVLDLAGEPLISTDRKILAWALCFFLAPLASIGLLPFVALDWLRQVDLRRPFRGMRFEFVLAAALIAAVSFLFFSSNPAAQERELIFPSPWLYALFVLLEGGLVWVLLWPAMRRDPQWWLAGFLLLCFPLVQFGSGRDFVMRASIAPLLFLMMAAGHALLHGSLPRWPRMLLIVLLAIGALTPLYEIDRSISRTLDYYLDSQADLVASPSSEPQTHLPQGVAPEAEHPGLLAADEIQTLKFMDDKLSKNFIANVRRSLYYQYLSPH